MSKAELKTKQTEVDFEAFLQTVADETMRADSRKIAEMMSKATGEPPKMWGANIVGFGRQPLKYASGREQEWMQIGFSPRKQNITLYLTAGEEISAELLAKLGKYKTGKSCLYVKRLSDVDESILSKLIMEAVEKIQK